MPGVVHGAGEYKRSWRRLNRRRRPRGMEGSGAVRLRRSAASSKSGAPSSSQGSKQQAARGFVQVDWLALADGLLASFDLRSCCCLGGSAFCGFIAARSSLTDQFTTNLQLGTALSGLSIYHQFGWLRCQAVRLHAAVRAQVVQIEMEVETELDHVDSAVRELAHMELSLPSPVALSGAATKVYRSYRTRRKLADSAVVVEELWWQALDFARLNHSTVSFYDDQQPESATSRWSRVSLNASKVGRGLSTDGKALKLAVEHWIEAIDPRHRRGHNLYFYYHIWCQTQAGQPFFYWLDIGEGKDVDLLECPRALLKKQCIRYLGPQEREYYEYIITEGKIVHKMSGEPLDTSQGPKVMKWIFVMSTAKKLYAGKKERGVFQHSSFLAGGATIAAGRFIAENGVIKSIWAYSGHYKPSAGDLSNFMSFLEENGVDLKEVEVCSFTKEDYYEDPVQNTKQNPAATIMSSDPPKLILPSNRASGPSSQTEADEDNNVRAEQARVTYQRTLSGGLQSPRDTGVSQEAILERVNSKSKSKSHQLGQSLSLQWSTGNGPRIGCVKDYPMELRTLALEMVQQSTTPTNGRASADLPALANLRT